MQGCTNRSTFLEAGAWVQGTTVSPGEGKVFARDMTVRLLDCSVQLAGLEAGLCIVDLSGGFGSRHYKW